MVGVLMPIMGAGSVGELAPAFFKYLPAIFV
jgi:hypothetical protein